ncbi:MAG TPA: LytTR family DNA-binding domain-containing protein [Cyclobacteriaceae bacterium]|jgi:two-component system LytT family response regulator|nr:LytTR family DNA-binding domain-containing protein [Cyclobacteriaceae bacterium]
MTSREDGVLRVVIVEDEPHSSMSLENLLRDYCSNTRVVGRADNITDGVREISIKRPDLLFLDIEMPGGNGFELLEQCDGFDFEVIFTTAFEHYALKAIKFSALDYLLKPIDVDELQEAVRKVVQKKERDHDNLKVTTLLRNLGKSKLDQTIALATAEGLEFIRVSDIYYCQAEGSYTLFHLKKTGKLLVSKHLKEYENLLGDYGFFRVHNSYLINLAEVARYVKGDGGYLIMNNGDSVGLSARRRDAFIRLFGHS